MTGLNLGGLVTVTLFVLSQGAPTAQPWRQCGVKGKMACPPGYTCEPITPQYSQCVQDGVVQLRRRQESSAVTGATSGVVDRQPVHAYARTAPREFNMFILGLSEMMNQTESDNFSYYEIAGIHGAPFKSWGGEPNPSNPPQMGYCTHSSALFATWHRPYLALLEQRIVFNAQQVAERFQGDDAQEWREAASRVRLPYWDWSDAGLGGAVPEAITAPRVSVQTPDGQQTMPNPLYSYRFTSNRKNTEFRFQSFRDSSETRRQPPRDMSASNNLAVEQAMRAGYSARRQNTYNLFSIERFNAFSNRAFRDNSSPDQLVSVESIHDEVHVAAGGNYGHMTYLEFSAFDPIFHIHHCNVDRLLAIYQAVHPGRSVEPQEMSTSFGQPDYVEGQMDTIDTPLYPFRKTDGNYFTSRDVSAASSVWDLGYGYPEVPASYQQRSQDELQRFARSRVDALYGPNSEDIQERDTVSSSTVASSLSTRASSSAVSSITASGPGSASSTSLSSMVASSSAASSGLESSSALASALASVPASVPASLSASASASSFSSVSVSGSEFASSSGSATSSSGSGSASVSGSGSAALSTSTFVSVSATVSPSSSGSPAFTSASASSVPSTLSSSSQTSSGASSASSSIPSSDSPSLTVSPSVSASPSLPFDLDEDRDVNKSPILDPNAETAPPRREYVLHCLFDQSELAGATQLLFFFGPPPTVSSPADYALASNLIGTASWFSMNLMKMPSKIVSATVPLTDNLRKAGISLNVQEAVDYLEDNLSWVIVNADQEVKDVKSLKIGVSSCDTKYIGGLARFGKWETHYQVTDSKTGGLTEDDAGKTGIDTEKAIRVTIKRGKDKWRKFENQVKEKMGLVGEEVKHRIDEVKDVFEEVVDGLNEGLKDLIEIPGEEDSKDTDVPDVPTEEKEEEKLPDSYGPGTGTKEPVQEKPVETKKPCKKRAV